MESREREGKPRKTNRPLREEGESEGLNGEREEWEGRGRYADYNLSHMAHLKRLTLSRNCVLASC